MASDFTGKAIVIMGVSGAGKSTIGEILAKALRCNFFDADDFHPQLNKDKMQKGIPLSDEDRIPWLGSLRDAVGEVLIGGRTVVLACSALQKHYREILRSADPTHELRSYVSAVKFVLLDVKVEVLAERVRKREAEGKHFMPATLLQSQLDLLQIDDCEGIFRIDATLRPQEIITSILEHRFL